MNYIPGVTIPRDAKGIAEFLERDLHRIAESVRDNGPKVFYRTRPSDQESLTAGVSANYKIANGNIVRVSTSSTITLTGLAYKTHNREIVLLNVGTGVLVLKPEASESSSSYRFALAATWQLSANAAAILWYDGQSSRHRGIART